MVASPIASRICQNIELSHSDQSATLLFLDKSRPGSGSVHGRLFRNPAEVVTARRLEDVVPALRRVEQLVDSGLTAAGFLAYEAGAAFESAMPRQELDGIPYVWFGLYHSIEPWTLSAQSGGAPAGSLIPGLQQEAYADAIERIREWIAAGDSYQVNFTFPMKIEPVTDPLSAFLALARSQVDAEHRCYVDIGRYHIASASPELFFRLDGDVIKTRPMKGTAPRHPDPAQDLNVPELLRSCPKERAENVMIVDLMRNDLGRIADVGSVRVERLFDVERYQTLWTMTSTVSARTHAAVPDIFAALFPCGSVTGAPKIRTMELIHDLESGPRGVYCGAIGWWAPHRHAEFNVAIRTLVLDTERETALYRVGGGITWDSSAEAEYEECLLKAAILNRPRPHFDLFESLRLENGIFWLYERHLHRLRTSAQYFDFNLDEVSILNTLEEIAAKHPQGLYKVRIQVSADGEVTAQSAQLSSGRPFRIKAAPRPIASQSPFVYNKTTCRDLYDEFLKPGDGLDDVILYNDRGDLTESTRANIVLQIDGELLTPPRSVGLLPGTFRQELLESGTVRERLLRKSDIKRASKVKLINSVRGWIDVEFVE